MTKIVSTGRTLFSEENYQKRKQVRKKKMTFWAVVFLILLIAVVLVSRIGKFQVGEVRVEGAQVIPPEEIIKSVLESFSGNYFWLIPKSNVMIFPRGKVREDLFEKFPRFSSVELSLEDTTLLAKVEERKPFALYCPSAERPEDAAACFFLDETGFIFDEAPAFSGTVYFVYSVLPTLENPKGSQLLPEENFRKLDAFIQALKKFGFEPIAVEVGSIETRLTLPHNSYVIWNSQDDLTLLYSNLEAFFNSEAIKSQPGFAAKLKSLDLRTENKVFYTFKK